MLKKNRLRLGVVAAVVAVSIGATAMPAIADPAAGQYKVLSGTGSDTIQDVLNGLATVDSNLGSYDAVGSAMIQTKVGGPSFVRPNGSTDGVKALSASINSTGTKVWNGVDITGQLDFARSSSSPSSSFPGTELTFIPFAKDGVTYAVNAGSDFPRNIPKGSAVQDSISPAPLTLRNIYRCTATTYVDAEFSPVTIRPLIPQSGSGTRSFWLSTLGLTESTKGSCVTDLGNTVQEHDGSSLTQAGDIVPFSIAQFVAQGNHADLPTIIAERRSLVELGQVGGVRPFIIGASGAEMNGAFPITRNVYNVVETARLADPAIAQSFVGTGSRICSAAGLATIKQYGFATIGSSCGSTTTKSGYYL